MEIIGKIIKVTFFDEIPLLEGRLKLPNNTWSPIVKFIIDTGYSGDVLVNSNLFPIWGNSIERAYEDAEIAESVTGEIFTLRSVDTFIQFEDLSIPIVVSSHPTIRENLLGWNLLKKFISVLDISKITILSD